jgi:hypothetical protein
MHTDGDWLDLDTFLDVRSSWVIGFLVLKNFLAAKRVHEGSATYSAGIEVSVRVACKLKV